MVTDDCAHVVHPEHWPGDAGCLPDLGHYDEPPPIVALAAVLAAHGFFDGWGIESD